MTNELERELSGLKQKDHVCPIYESADERTAVAVSFIKEGLARGERCLYVSSDQSVSELAGALDAAGIDFAYESGREALRLLTERDAYLLSGEFQPRPMIAFLRQTEAQALADGFSGLRSAGDMTWEMGPAAGRERWLEYEALLNRFLEDSRTVVLCQYNRARFGPDWILDVLRTHPVAVLGGQVCPNPYYEPPELVLHSESQESSEFKAKRVDWWIAQLKQARRAEQEREHIMNITQTLSRRLLEVQEAERRHLALELHDEVGQSLTGLRLLLKPDGGSTADAARARLEQARGIVDGLLERVRGLSFDLRPAALDQLGLLPALLALFERFTEQTGVQVHFKHHGVEQRFAPAVETTAYRIVQEALTNVARHAGETGVTVRVWATADLLSVQIEDQGRGFDPEAALATPRSSGLAGMQERVMLVDGDLTVESHPGDGTQITAELPLPGSGGER
jgi:signal transduction histidine kinase